MGANMGTLMVNNQIVPAPMTSAYFPNGAQYPYYTGSGQGPATIPLNYASSQSGGSGSAASTAAALPFSVTNSPVIWAIIFLVVGVAGLRYIHWRG